MGAVVRKILTIITVLAVSGASYFYITNKDTLSIDQRKIYLLGVEQKNPQYSELKDNSFWCDRSTLSNIIMKRNKCCNQGMHLLPHCRISALPHCRMTQVDSLSNAKGEIEHGKTDHHAGGHCSFVFALAAGWLGDFVGSDQRLLPSLGPEAGGIFRVSQF